MTLAEALEDLKWCDDLNKRRYRKEAVRTLRKALDVAVDVAARWRTEIYNLTPNDEARAIILAEIERRLAEQEGDAK